MTQIYSNYIRIPWFIIFALSMLSMPPAGGCEAGFAAGFGAVSCTIPMFEHRFPPKKKSMRNHTDLYPQKYLKRKHDMEVQKRPSV